jgi:hypothetical protein
MGRVSKKRTTGSFRVSKLGLRPALPSRLRALNKRKKHQATANISKRNACGFAMLQRGCSSNVRSRGTLPRTSSRTQSPRMELVSWLRQSPRLCSFKSTLSLGWSALQQCFAVFCGTPAGKPSGTARCPSGRSCSSASSAVTGCRSQSRDETIDDALAPRNPITGIAACPARATIGQAAARPTRVMNSRAGAGCFAVREPALAAAFGCSEGDRGGEGRRRGQTPRPATTPKARRPPAQRAFGDRFRTQFGIVPDG